MDKWTYCPVNLSATRNKLQCVSASPPFPRLGVLLLCLESVSCFCVDIGGAGGCCWDLVLPSVVGGAVKNNNEVLKVFLKVLPQNIDISYIIPLLMRKGRVPTMAHVVSAGELPGNTPPGTYMYIHTCRWPFSGKSQQNPHMQSAILLFHTSVWVWVSKLTCSSRCDEFYVRCFSDSINCYLRKKKAKMGWSGPTSTQQLCEEAETGNYEKATIFPNNYKTENDTVQ